ncbi:MAG: hypothetical protein PVJ55_02720 [Anaerolineae bacterium]
MARGTDTQAAIGVCSTHADVRRNGRRQRAIGHHLHTTPVTLLAAQDGVGEALHPFSQNVVRGIQDVTSLRVPAQCKLLCLADVTSGLVVGRRREHV